MGTLILTRLAAPFGMWETHSAQPFAETPDAMVALCTQWRESCRNGQSIPKALDFELSGLDMMA